MEKRLPLIFILLIFVNSLFAQNVSQKEKIQILLWAEQEQMPGVEFEGSVERIKKTAQFLIEGMVYGWNYEYTPYDKTRNVQEYFEIFPIQELTEQEINSIQYKNTAFKDSRLYARVEFERSETQKLIYESFESLSSAKIKGKGNAKLEDGFEGIQSACKNAMKSSVREYWRSKIKNKPKEIDGKLFLCRAPVIGIENGQYVVTLEFFMETDKITKYKMF